jgi:peptidoglycan/LPS O-acetylase OafA/YrhL
VPAIDAPASAAVEVRHRRAIRDDIDGMRGLSVLLVVAFHAFPGLVPGGFIGVDVFFVISGYLITQIIADELHAARFTIYGFYARRIRRIFPALVVVLAACLGFGWFSLLGDEYASLGKHVAGGAGFVSNLVLLDEIGYFDTAAHLKPLLHLWSLGIEEQFYLVYPVLLWTCWRWQRAVPWLLAAALAASFGADLHRLGSDSAAAFYLPGLRGWELFAGGLLALVEHRRGGPFANGSGALSWLGALGIAAICGSALALQRGSEFPGLSALVPVLGAVAVICAGPMAWFNRTLVAQPVMAWFGRISFPFYLWHWPLLSFAYVVGPELLPRWFRMLAVIASVALAWLTYRYVERPLRFGGPSRTKVASLLAGMVFVGLGGLWLFRADGAQARLPGHMRVASAPPPVQCLPTDPAGAKCWGASTSGTTILLVGDSHGMAFAPGLALELARSAPSTRLVSMARERCMPLLGVVSLDPGGADRGCREFVEDAFTFASRPGNVSAVLFVGRWASRVGRAQGFREKEGAESRGEYRFPDSPEGMQGNSGAFSAGLVQSLARLRRVPTVVFVHQVPELGLDPRECVSRPLRDAPKKPAESCSVLVEDVRARQAEYRWLVTRALASFPATRQFEPGASLCDLERCRALREGSLMYRDDDHLNVNGASLVAARLARTELSPGVDASLAETQP